jgi:6,7-dimethyl-8-ribityllumazine synthase
VRGEIDVPDGYTVLEGAPLGDRRSVGVVISRFNGGVTNQLLRRALEALTAAGVSNDGITILPVPGAFELPLAAMALAKTRRYACIVALGAIVRGETPHFDYVAAECASGLQLAGIETGRRRVGVLTVDNVAQAGPIEGPTRSARRSRWPTSPGCAPFRQTARDVEDGAYCGAGIRQPPLPLDGATSAVRSNLQRPLLSTARQRAYVCTAARSPASSSAVEQLFRRR